MGTFAVNGTSEIQIDDQYFTICIARRACAPWIWTVITKLVQTAGERLCTDHAEETGLEHIPLTRPGR